nr:hypothetical protein GCM10025699_35640 [Microbacterium flavescens]
MGFRYRIDVRPERDLSIKADIVFTQQRVAVFVDGCFWHGCPEHYRVPSTNSSYWGPKIEKNAARDRHAVAALTSRGWLVLRYWEHERPIEVARAIAQCVLTQKSPSR